MFHASPLKILLIKFGINQKIPSPFYPKIKFTKKIKIKIKTPQYHNWIPLNHLNIYNKKKRNKKRRIIKEFGSEADLESPIVDPLSAEKTADRNRVRGIR